MASFSIFVLHSRILRAFPIKTESKLTLGQAQEPIYMSSLFSPGRFPEHLHAFDYTPPEKLIFAALIVAEKRRTIEH
jgi:hypothetical protein